TFHVFWPSDKLAICRADLWSQRTVHCTWHGNTSKMNPTIITLLICSLFPPLSLRFCLISFKTTQPFTNNSNNSQTPVQTQLVVTLYHMGHYGNGVCLEDIAQIAWIFEGSVELFTEWCFKAIKSLHDAFVCMPTAEEKEFEKVWMDNRVSFRGLW
ncbi:hypothetical protein PAXRUDRAFT_589735, partial [Paxillus rubicundulus Ve08.2h10]